MIHYNIYREDEIMNSKTWFLTGVVCLVSSLGFSQGKSLEEMKKELKSIDEKMDRLNEDWGAAGKASHQLKKQIEEKCKIDYSAYQANGNSAVKDKKCEEGYFKAIESNITRLDIDQSKYQRSVDDLSLQYQAKIDEAKKNLDSKEAFELLNFSNTLHNSKLKGLSTKFKGDFTKAEYNRIKSDIEKSRENVLATKAITTTLNSELFCRAKDNCGTDQKISESEVNSKIMKSISSKMAKDKVSELQKPVEKVK